MSRFVNLSTPTPASARCLLVGEKPAAARCAPPDNKPTPEEFANCREYLERELDLQHNIQVIVALGKIAFDAYLTILKARGTIASRAWIASGRGIWPTKIAGTLPASGSEVRSATRPSQPVSSPARVLAVCQLRIGLSPMASLSRHRIREFRGRGAGLFSSASLADSSSAGSMPATAKPVRANVSKLAPSPEFTTW